MKKENFNIKKWAVRAMVTVGAMLGITSCCIFRPHSSPNNPAETVYGPPPDIKLQKTEVLEDVYGPPVEKLDTAGSEIFIEPEKPVGTKTE